MDSLSSEFFSSAGAEGDEDIIGGKELVVDDEEHSILMSLAGNDRNTDQLSTTRNGLSLRGEGNEEHL